MNEIIDAVVLIALCMLCGLTGLKLHLMGYEKGKRKQR
jgi:hypothetical protein